MPQYSIQEQWDIYYPKVYGYYFRRVDQKADVEDLTSLVMETFLKAINKPDKSIPNPNAYLWRIAHNKLVDYIKNKSNQPKISALDENLNIFNESLENYRSSHYQAKIQNLMRCVENTLSGLDFKIVQMSIIMDRKSADVAKELNLSADNVRQKLSRGVKKLREKCRDIWNLT